MVNLKLIGEKMANVSPAVATAVGLVSKDIVGCYMYTSTARKNKKYSPEKRADVANYDLANGVINIGLQFLAIKPIESLMTKLSESKLMKHFFKDYDSRLASTNHETVMDLLKTKGGLVKGSVVLFSVIVCQYLIKRFISPYFSMPAAEKFKNWGLIKPKIYEDDFIKRDSMMAKFRWDYLSPFSKNKHDNEIKNTQNNVTT